MEAKLLKCKEGFVNQMNGGPRKNLVLVTMCVPDQKEEDLHFIKNSNTHKEVEVQQEYLLLCTGSGPFKLERLSRQVLRGNA